MTSTESLNLGPIDQIGLTCTDLADAQRFYCDILGLTHIADAGPQMRIVGCGGVNLILFKADTVPPNSCIYFRVPGQPGLIQQKMDALKSHGVTIERDAHCIARNFNGHDVWLAFFRDPFGNLLALKSDVTAKE
jgi:catechol 2,3-dioxygenase-like lactoylglutathione lyase family enzyme